MRISRRGVVVGLLVALLGAAAVIGSVQLLGSEKVLYLAPDAPGPNPFTEPAVFASANQRIAQAATTTTTTVAPDPSAGFLPVDPGVTAPGVPVGGASGECDRELLIQMLNQSPERKAQWAKVQNIPADDVETYIRSLTPSVLTRDTRVSSFGFKDGEAEETQAILASGTSVLVNGNGEVVLRCYSGTPIKPPRKIKYNCEGCPDNFKPPPACNGTCYVVPTTTTTVTLPPTTTSLDTTSTTTAAARSTVTRRARPSTTRRAAGATTTTTNPPVNQTTGTLFPPNTGTFAPPATAGPSSTALTSVPGGGSSTTTGPTPSPSPSCTGVLCGIVP